MINVRDIMQTEIVSVPPNALIEQALDLMLEYKVSGLPVIDETGTLVGVISEYDALELICDASESYWPIEPVVGLMSTEVESVDVNLQLAELADQFLNRSIRRLPVTDQGRVVGIVSRRDVMKAIRNERRRLSQMPLNLTNGLSACSPQTP